MFSKFFTNSHGSHSSSLVAKAAILPMAIGTLAMLGMTAGAASASVVGNTIIFDSFYNDGNGVSINGLSPSTDGTPPAADLPGGTWYQPAAGESWVATSSAGYNTGDGWGALGNGGQISDAISISSAGSFTKPTAFVISADIQVLPGTTGAAAGGRGVGLGFFSTHAADSGTFSQNFFTGLVLDSSGNLNLIQDPNASDFFGAGSFLGTPVAYSGATFNPSQFYHLSYQVNTATGGISNISLQGSAADYSSFDSTALFTDSATANAGIYDSSTTGGAVNTGNVDNFKVAAAVPEPATLGLTAIGGVALLLVSRKRKAQA